MNMNQRRVVPELVDAMTDEEIKSTAMRLLHKPFLTTTEALRVLLHIVTWIIYNVLVYAKPSLALWLFPIGCGLFYLLNTYVKISDGRQG